MRANTGRQAAFDCTSHTHVFDHAKYTPNQCQPTYSSLGEEKGPYARGRLRLVKSAPECCLCGCWDG